MPDIHRIDEAVLKERIGALHQLVRVDQFSELNGPSRGSRRFRMVNGGGLEVEVHPDRSLDLGQVTKNGIPLAWMSPTGVTSPFLYDPRGNGWLRTFGGGMLATCGLDTFGPPSTDAGDDLGQHGRVGTQPAEVIEVKANHREVLVAGTVRQARTLGENLVMRREIRSEAGSDTLVIHDVVTNEGFAAAPHMILYHLNLGWPLVSERATLNIPSAEVEPRDGAAEAGADSWGELNPPTAGWNEQVFRHDFAGRAVTASVTNADLGLRVTVRFTSDGDSCLYQWKMMGQGHYVLGLEPSNCRNIFGRSAARAAGELPELLPGASADHTVTLTIEEVVDTTRRQERS